MVRLLRTVSCCLAASILLTSCMSIDVWRLLARAQGNGTRMSLDEMRRINRSKLRQLALGMTRRESIEWMGRTTFYEVSGRFVVANPYRIESYEGANGSSYEIAHYYTDLHKADNILSDDEMTPLLFENGRLIAWGRKFVANELDRRVSAAR